MSAPRGDPARPLRRRLRNLLLQASGLGRLNDKVDRLLAAAQRLEHFSHGSQATFLGNNRVLVRAVVGDAPLLFIVEADDRLISPLFIATGTYEPGLTDFLGRTVRPDGHGLDVGANFGWFTCLMAHLSPAGRVVGVEPDAPIHALLRDNIAINGFGGRAEARHAAAAVEGGLATLYRRTGRSGNTGMAPASKALTDHMGEPPVTSFQVPTVRVDDLLDGFGGRLDLMKVDVEGAEPLVFRGAREAVARNPRLVVLMEWSPDQIRHAGFDVGGFLSELDGMRLTPSVLEDGRERPVGFDALLSLPYQPGVVLRRA